MILMGEWIHWVICFPSPCYLAYPFLMSADARKAVLIAFPFWSFAFSFSWQPASSQQSLTLWHKPRRRRSSMTQFKINARWEMAQLGIYVVFPFEGEQTVIKALPGAPGNRRAVLFIELSQGASSVLQSYISELIWGQGCHVFMDTSKDLY